VLLKEVSMEQVELKDFIKTTLIEIAEGIKGANEELKCTVFSLRRNKGDLSKIPGIQFDIAVTAAKNQKDKGGFMVALVNIGGGASTEKGISNEMVHRIKLEIGIEEEWT
jgi:hypothetical protein